MVRSSSASAFWALHPMRLVRVLVKGNAAALVRVYLHAILACRAKGWTGLGRVFARRLQRRHGVFIACGAEIEPDLALPHPVGIVIGAGVRIDAGVTIYQNVTIGGARIGDFQAGNYPRIGAGTVIFSGAAVLGDVRIGRNCVIGANAVVTRDIPDNATAVGAPARVVRTPLRICPPGERQPARAVRESSVV